MASKVDKRALFETMSVPKSLAIMAVPTVLSQVVVLAYNIADTYFLGRTDNEFMIGGVSLVLTIYLSLVAISNLFGVGGGSLMARLLGKGDAEEARKVASHSLLLGLLSALAFSLLCLALMNPLLRLLGASEATLPYAKTYLLYTVIIGGVPTALSLIMPTLLRNVGYAKEAGIGVAIGGLLNIGLDPLFMFVFLPPGSEVLGAALATLTSNLASFLFFLIIYLRVRRKTVLCLPRRFEKLKKDSVKSFYSVGIPAASVLIFFNILGIVFNRLAASSGDTVLAAVAIVSKLEKIPQNIGLGVCLAMVPLVAYNYARKDYKRMDRFFLSSTITVQAIAIFSAVLFLFLAEPLIGLFIQNQEVIAIGARFLKVRTISISLMLIGFQMSNYMQAINRGILSFLISLLRQIVFSIPVMLLFNSFLGLDGLMWSQPVADVAFVAIPILFYVFVRKTIGKGGKGAPIAPKEAEAAEIPVKDSPKPDDEAEQKES